MFGDPLVRATKALFDSVKVVTAEVLAKKQIIIDAQAAVNEAQKAINEATESLSIDLRPKE